MVDRKEVKRAAAVSVIAAIVLTVMKIAVGILSNSLGIISEALHSGLDLMAAGITYIAVIRAAKAPDAEHPFGHGKIENFAALAETILLWITSVWIVYEALRRITESEWPEASMLGIAVMVISIIINYERSKLLSRVAAEHGSQALEADALHFYADMITSVVVLFGLGFVWFGLPIGDPLSAIGVAIVIFVISLQLGKRASNILLDSSPEGVEDTIKKICIEISGVHECRRVRARESGPHLFLDIVVSIEPNVNVSEAHNIAELIEARVSHLAQVVDCVVHIEPTDQPMSERGNDIYSKLASLARTHPQIDSIHNIRILDIPEGIHLVADLEISSEMSLEEAHIISDEFEDSIKTLSPEIKTIALHLEASESTTSAEDVTKNSEDLIIRIKDIVERTTSECACKDVLVAEDEQGLIVSLNCGIRGSMTLTESHEIAEEIKRVINQEINDAKVFVHMEPM